MATLPFGTAAMKSDLPSSVASANGMSPLDDGRLHPAPMLDVLDTTVAPGSSQLKRHTAIRREASSSDLRPRSQRSSVEYHSSPLQRELLTSSDLNSLPSPPSDTAERPIQPRVRNGSISRRNGCRLFLNFDDQRVSDENSRRISAEDPRTPRPREAHADSPVSASSGSSEDDKPLLTPLDETVGIEGGPLGPSSFSRPSVQTPPESLAAARVGMRLGVGNIGASIDVGQLGLGLGGRRGVPDATPSPKPEGDHSKRDLGETAMRASGSRQRAPMLSRETLYQMGTVSGLTPPASSVAAAGGLGTEAGSVVSNGLEMGLGMNLAAAALIQHIPGSTAAVSGLAERRYMRPSGGSQDNGSLTRGTFGSESAQHKSGESSAAAAAEAARDDGTGAVPPPQASDDAAELDLQRRRTTGGMDAHHRRGDATRQTRHHRADTHDPVIIHARSRLLQEQQEKQQYQQDNYMSVRPSPKLTTQDLPMSYMLDMPLSAGTSLDRNSSLGGQSSGRARASFGGSTHAATPSLSEMAFLSPDAQLHADGVNPFHLGASNGLREGRTATSRARDLLQHDAPNSGPPNGALMGLGAGGHFAPGVRAKVVEVLPRLIAAIPLSGHEGETVTIAEYGCLNTRSVQLMQPIISWFAEKAHQQSVPAETCEAAGAGVSANESYFSGAGNGIAAPSMRSALGSGAQNDVPCRVNFSVIHEDSPQADFRPVAQTLNISSESYLNNHWQATHEPSLQNAIFQSFASRPFASRIVPPSTVHLGMSLMDLHWSHTPRNPGVSLATSAHAELTAFLTARAHEFRKGGIFLMAYISRSEDGARMPLPDRPKSTVSFGGLGKIDALPAAATSEESTSSVDLTEPLSPSTIPGVPRERSRSNSTPNRPTLRSPTATGHQANTDIWTTLTDTLAPCLQRLVSCGMLKSDVARHLLTLPMHPRTPKQTQGVLRSVKHLWKVEWSCGLDDAVPAPEDRTPTEANELRSEAEPLRLPHPAWKALQAGTLSRVAFAEHMIQLFKNLYEAHFRLILREKGRLSKGAVEFVLDSLWDVLQSRIDDQEPCPIAQCELEVQVVALRRL